MLNSLLLDISHLWMKRMDFILFLPQVMMMKMITSVGQEREGQYLSVSGMDGSYRTPKCQSRFLKKMYFNVANERSQAGQWTAPYLLHVF